MKKTIFITLILMISISATSQNKIVTILEDGNLIGETVIVLNNKTSSEIYKKSLEWISYNFSNTESVIQSQIENKMIRLEGVSKSVFGPVMGFHYDFHYTIQADIKEGKLRFRATDLKQVSQSQPFTKTALELMFKKNGDLRSPKNRYSQFKEQMDKELSNLTMSLINHIEGKSKTNDAEW